MMETTMRNQRSRFLSLLILLLPLPARAALTPVGSPLVIAESTSCSFVANLEVIATPKGAFEVVWADDAVDGVVKGQRFARNLLPTGSPQTLLPLHGGLFFSDFVGVWTSRYEVALNAVDDGENPDDPLTGYRASLDPEGHLLLPVARIKPSRFVALTPAGAGDSLQFRLDPPLFGPASCRSEGLLARRIDPTGAALGPESRITRRASGFSPGHFKADRLPNDTFVAVYSTCDQFDGLVARRLNDVGAPVGNPINLPFPALLGNFSAGGLVLAARDGVDFAVGAMVSSSTFSGSYTRGVVNGKVFGPNLLPIPPGMDFIPGLLDLAASPAGGYLLLFQNSTINSTGSTLFAQELDAKGVPRGAAVVVGEETVNFSSKGIAAAAASLPNGRWIVVMREQNGDLSSCSERLLGTVLRSE
jgi:hypothetical protein